MFLQPIFNTSAQLVIAGPCSAESEQQTFETARLLKDAGVGIFRAGVWKPRTKPGGFEGRGSKALPWLRRVREELGMEVVTEIATPRHLREALDAGIRAFWIGARTTTNPFAVQEIADVLASLPDELKEEITVLVKNPVNPDLELWIGAMERIYSAGIKRLGAIHRGFSSYGKHLYRNQPRWAIPLELYRRIPGIPILFDPSHIAGRSELVAPLARQAAGMNYDGFIIEAHSEPERALSDASQQLSPSEVAELLPSLARRSGSESAGSLAELREKIDRIDNELIHLLAERMEISGEIGRYKRTHHIPVYQPERYRKLMERLVDEAAAKNLSPEFVRNLLALIHEESVRRQLPSEP